MALIPSRRKVVCFLVSAALGALSTAASATHSWNGYHWARTANPFNLKLGDNVTSSWDSYLATTSSDWSKSTVLDTTIVAGQAGRPRQCRATLGRVEVCNTTYGNNGWLGVASISINGSHITQGTVKLNDTYFNTATYNTPAWRNLVTCQEVGHTFGLDHQDENFNNANLGTCMDYTNDPSSNQHPNTHDYDELVTIYSHTDSTTTVGQAVANSAAAVDEDDEPENWGVLVKQSRNGRVSVYELDEGNGRKKITFVMWALELNGNRPH
jgi:hypothetical protein